MEIRTHEGWPSAVLHCPCRTPFMAGAPPDIDPIIRGLLARLPQSGDVWPEIERKLWLQLLEGSFKLIYKDSEETKTIPEWK